MPSTLRFGGRQNKWNSTSGAGLFEPLLSRLSWKYVVDEPKYEPLEIDLVDSQRLRALLSHWVGRSWIYKNSMPTGDALRKFNIMSLEGELRDFVKKNGDSWLSEPLTLDECWASSQLNFGEPVHVFIAKQYETELGSHIPKVSLHPQQLVWSVAAICSQFEYDRPTFPLLVTDGFEGHSIMIAGLSGIRYKHPRGQIVESGWLSFHDPLPCRSFLAPERGFTGAGALEDISRPPYWVISPDDLSQVIAAFVLPQSQLNELRSMFATLNGISAKWLQSGMVKPLWQDFGDAPFGLLLAMKQGRTPLTEEGLRGLARLEVLIRET